MATWTAAENAIFFRLWPRLLKGEITRGALRRALPRHTWGALRLHGKKHAGGCLPIYLSLDAAAQKAGYTRKSLMIMLRRHGKAVAQRNAAAVRPQMIVAWADVLDAIKLSQEYLTLRDAAQVMGVHIATLRKRLADEFDTEIPPQPGRPILVRRSLIERMQSPIIPL